jgi:hypothetical protein
MMVLKNLFSKRSSVSSLLTFRDDSSVVFMSSQLFQSDSLFKIFKPDEILKGWNKLSKNFLVVNHHYNDTQLLCMSEKKEKKRTVNIHVCMRHSHFLLVPSLPGVMLFTL